MPDDNDKLENPDHANDADDAEDFENPDDNTPNEINSDAPEFHVFEDSIENLQAQLDALGLEEIDWGRPITPADIDYLLQNWQFLQMVSIMEATAFSDVVQVTAPSGWIIHNYGDALSSSPGKFLWKNADFHSLFMSSNKDDEGGESGEGGKGTLIKQAVDTAFAMIELAKEMGWQGVKLIDGHPLMKWAAWMRADEIGLPLEGYTPSDSDLKKRKRIQRSSVDDQRVMLRSRIKR